MATVTSIAIRNENALERLNVSLVVISEQFGIKPPTITTEYRDPSELPTMQLEEIAAWADTAIDAIKERLNDDT